MPPTAYRAQRNMANAVAAFSYPFSAKKHKPAALTLVFLGVTSCFTAFQATGVVSMFVAAARIADLRAEIARTINSKEIRGIGAAKLVGRLMFTLSWAAGSFGKAVLQPLFAVSQRPKHGRTPPQWSRPPGPPVLRTGVRARKAQTKGLQRVPPSNPLPGPHMDGRDVRRGRQQRRFPSRLRGLLA